MGVCEEIHHSRRYLPKKSVTTGESRFTCLIEFSPAVTSKKSRLRSIRRNFLPYNSLIMQLFVYVRLVSGFGEAVTLKTEFCFTRLLGI